MFNKFDKSIRSGRDADPEIKTARKPYTKPVLEKLEDLRTLTLGGSPGMGDSGPLPIPQVSKPPF